jgi:hypothetical protein
MDDGKEANRKVADYKNREFWVRGLWLSIPTTYLLSLVETLPGENFVFFTVLFAFAAGFPWNLIAIPWGFIALGGGGDIRSAVLLFHFIATTINGALLTKLFWFKSIKNPLLRILFLIGGALVMVLVISLISLTFIGL